MDLSLKITSMEQEKETVILLSEFSQTDKEAREEVLRMAKAGVADLAWYSCIILIGVIALRHDKEVLEIFRLFRECLKRRIEPHHPLVVVEGIFALVEDGEIIIRFRQEPSNSNTMKLKGEAHQSWVFTPQEKFNVCSMLERLCDQIIFMENMVKQVMTQTVGVDTMRDYIQECQSCLQSMDKAVSSRLIQMSPLSLADWLLWLIIGFVVTERSKEKWSKFELYHHPFTTLSE